MFLARTLITRLQSSQYTISKTMQMYLLTAAARDPFQSSGMCSQLCHAQVGHPRHAVRLTLQRESPCERHLA